MGRTADRPPQRGRPPSEKRAEADKEKKAVGRQDRKRKEAGGRIMEDKAYSLGGGEQDPLHRRHLPNTPRPAPPTPFPVRASLDLQSACGARVGAPKAECIHVHACRDP